MTRRLPALLLAAALAAGTLTACGSDKADEQLSPAERGPKNVSGQSSCVYIDSPAECKDSGVPEERWFRAPTDEPPRQAPAGQSQADHDWLLQLFLFQMAYHSWFSSPSYVNHYVVVEHRTVYRTQRTTFDRRYAAQEKTQQAKATYRSASGKTVSGAKVDPKKFTPAAPRNAGGDRGKAPCQVMTLDGLTRPGGGSGGGGRGTSGGRSTSRSGTTGGSKPKPPAPKQPVGGDRGKGAGSQHGC